MAESFTINSLTSRAAFNNYVDGLFKKHGYITFGAPRIGADRSISQNSLFHVWATEYAAYILRKDKREVLPGELDGMKRTIKQRFTLTYPDCKNWTTYEIINPFTNERKRDYTSSKTWRTGEMFMVLTFVQMTAAQDGLILESKGQFAKNQRKSNGD